MSEVEFSDQRVECFMVDCKAGATAAAYYDQRGKIQFS